MSKKKSPIFDQTDIDFINQKSAYIFEDLEKIEKVLKDFSYEELITNGLYKDATERWLERVITRILDINFYLLRKLKGKTPKTYRESFAEMVAQNIITQELCEQVQPCAGARNTLVHEYDHLDSIKFYKSLQNTIKLFPKYIKAVSDFVEKHKK
ncbi:MAG: hypothetical protein A2233_05035 [Candidatus Kerfeldbacteria bacterium RIFOXYA2_FULL_38_24]|uniref:DUF86 domain-containing protein n=1 Tax=Candidatus Kerfeldbacteria bacterium RIFOXYB2_FULL_38_14 TaxID=1798547 RepID=A0A1G2BBM7_9BACT|nr:MAG: hypothetical protein A2233_05035 [Candidatus Kerfeldbacteria bacterium RIFOXYA2_FULL_38_24]OGY85690.1 MAG: hypothetical protein A2319_05305 [Candidatus Kerfeldbacteria bacterium RIFOXYB2_FULL_38_14]OGY88376.1 MAG: hypothetical protein A2458_02840 [Candidatus Kerfeldbacteria bacterium RIFOXYC2_FULL_38_9]